MVNIPFIKDTFYTLKGIYLYETWLKKSCYWDIARMKKYQFDKLKLLLNEANENVPYYKEHFKEINFNPKLDFTSLECLNKIPVLSKEIAKNRKLEFINPKYKKNSLLFKTSGSTGHPFEVWIHPDHWILEQGVIWRHWKWGGYKFRDALAMVRSFVPPDENTLWRTNKLSNFTYFSPFHLNDFNISRYLEVMIKKEICILRGYPSSLAIMADYILKSNCRIPKLKMLLTASEVLSDNDRDKIELAFKARIFNHYGLAEQIVMMGDCHMHEGMHNYDEYGYLELLDTDDPKIKRIVGTNLNNLTTPLIRYDTGDLAILADRPCSCGKTLPTIKNIIGRKDSGIETTEGFKIPTVNFYTMFEAFQEIDRWQIVQHNLKSIEFIIKSDTITQDRISFLLDCIYKRLNLNIEVNISLNKPFVYKGEGKINAYISYL